jgi:2-hydroxyglutarate dehydrogenase
MKNTLKLYKQLARYAYRPPDYRVDNLVIGGGVIGLAVGARLRETRPDETTIVVERHRQVSFESYACLRTQALRLTLIF